MLVSGFNQFKPDSSSSMTKRASKGDSSKSSFEDVLGRTSNEKTKEKDKTSTETNANEQKDTQSNLKSNGERSNFGGNKNEASARTETAPSQSSKTEAKTDVKTDSKTETKDVEAKDLGSPALPTSTAPNLPTSPITDRLTYAQQGVVVNPLAKMQPTPNQDDGVDSLTRRAVWTDFLRKMKDDLGVGAEDMMDAFASLSPEDLAKPPEQTVDKVVMALGLNDSQAQLARQYLNDLIHKTQSKSLGEELNASQKQISLTLMSQRELDRKALERSLDALNHNFFKNQAPRPVAQQNAKSVQKDEDAQSNDDQVRQDSIAAFMSRNEDDATPSASMPNATPSAGPTQTLSAPSQQVDPRQTAKINKLVEKMQAAEKSKTSESDDAQIDQLLQKFVAPQAASSMKAHSSQAQLVKNAQTQQAQVMPEAMKNAKPAPTQNLNLTNNALKGLLGIDRGQSDDASGGDTDANADASHIGSVLNADTRTQGLNAKSGEFQAQMTQGQQAPQAMSVPDLVKQAQIMIRDGGGEMKVTMHPDGLGEVAMRVTVEKGKVGVQMITESDEAKKLIERQLGDLKSSLSNNHLQLDTIKVDTATNLGKQLEQQYHDAQRQQAHMQWEQFRQDQPGGWKQSFFDINSIRQAYQSDSQAPRDAKAPTASARSLGSRRLDLVA